MARYLVKSVTTGLYLQGYCGIGSNPLWTADPLQANDCDDPRTAAYFASQDWAGKVGEFEIVVLVVSTRVVVAPPYNEKEYWDRTVRSGPKEAFSVSCPQCKAKKDQPCVVRNDRDGIVHGLRRQKYLKKNG